MIIKQNHKRYIGFVLYVAFVLLCAAIVLLNLGCGRSVAYSVQPAYPSVNAGDKIADVPDGEVSP